MTTEQKLASLETLVKQQARLIDNLRGRVAVLEKENSRRKNDIIQLNASVKR